MEKKKLKRKSSTKRKTSTRKRSPVKTKTVYRAPPKSVAKKANTVNTEKMLIENFVSLQKVMVNLSVKFDNVSNQISKLLELFELSAKSLAEKDFNLEKGGIDTKKIIEKLERVLDQNKILGKGLALLHEPVSEQSSFKSPVQKPTPELSAEPHTEPAKELSQIESSATPATQQQATPEQSPLGGYELSISAQSQPSKQLPEA